MEKTVCIRVIIDDGSEESRWCDVRHTKEEPQIGSVLFLRTGSSHGQETFGAFTITQIVTHSDRLVYHLAQADGGFSQPIDSNEVTV